MSDAYDAVVKKDGNGVLLPPSKWANDDVKPTIARTKYLSSNCVLVK